MDGVSDRQIGIGLKFVRDHVGFFDVGVFRKLCFQVVNTYQPPPQTARLSDYSTLGDERFRELAKVTQAMNEETGIGPIRRATLDGKLNRHFVMGKSADEIISYCQELYG